MLHTLGHFPFKVSITNDKVDFNECDASVAHCMIIFALSALYVGFAHFSMQHHLHHLKNSVIVRVSLFQILAVTVTGVIGVFNSLCQRKNIVKVWLLLNCLYN